MSQQDAYLVEELRSNKTIEDNFRLLGPLVYTRGFFECTGKYKNFEGEKLDYVIIY